MHQKVAVALEEARGVLEREPGWGGLILYNLIYYPPPQSKKSMSLIKGWGAFKGLWLRFMMVGLRVQGFVGVGGGYVSNL